MRRRGSDDALDLKEAAEPPDLEETLADDDADDEEIPPLDSGVGALGRIAVVALAENDVLLLVLDLGQELGEAADWKGGSSAGLEAEKGSGWEEVPSASIGSEGISDSTT